MKLNFVSSRMLAIMALTVVLAGATMVLGRSRPVSNVALGDGWACSRTAFVVTICAPAALPPMPATETSSKDAVRRAPRV